MGGMMPFMQASHPRQAMQAMQGAGVAGGGAMGQAAQAMGGGANQAMQGAGQAMQGGGWGGGAQPRQGGGRRRAGGRGRGRGGGTSGGRGARRRAARQAARQPTAPTAPEQNAPIAPTDQNLGRQPELGRGGDPSQMIEDRTMLGQGQSGGFGGGVPGLGMAGGNMMRPGMRPGMSSTGEMAQLQGPASGQDFSQGGLTPDASAGMAPGGNMAGQPPMAPPPGPGGQIAPMGGNDPRRMQRGSGGWAGQMQR